MHTTTHALTEALKQKQTLVLFPEGTTTKGDRVDKFHPGLFQAAINADKPIQPVALSYKRNGQHDEIAAYIGNDNFIFSLIQIMAQKKTEVEMTFCNPLKNESMNRVELAATSHHLIAQAIKS